MKTVSPISTFPPSSRARFRIQRAFKALDDGRFRKWIFVVKASDLPLRLPLDANARMPNILKNGTCAEMRETLLFRPEHFQILNGGAICTGSAAEVSEEGGEKFAEIAFSAEAAQGIVNGGHTYATLTNFVFGETMFSGGRDLKEVLTQDAKKDNAGLFEFINDEPKLAERVALARENAHVQFEFVMPVNEPEELERIARARNLSQSVEATAFANLAGRFEWMKEVLRSGPSAMQALEKRVIWKTNQEVSEDGKAIAAKTLINLLAMMDIHKFPVDKRPAHAVYGHASVVVREFAEAEGAEKEFQDSLTRLLPKFIELYDEVYSVLPDTDPNFPWADGKFDPEPKKRQRKTSAVTPFLNKPCKSKVLDAFVWPIYAAFRVLLREEPATKTVAFESDPIELFHELKGQLAGRTIAYHGDKEAVQHIGKDKEIWLRLDSEVVNELRLRERLAKK
jgi:hypothetical protein